MTTIRRQEKILIACPPFGKNSVNQPRESAVYVTGCNVAKVTRLLPQIRASGTHDPQGSAATSTFVPGRSASPLRVRRTANGSFALGTADGIAYVANRVNQRRLTKLFPEPTNEHLNQLGIVFMRVLPYAFTQLRACEHASRFPH